MHFYYSAAALALISSSVLAQECPPGYENPKLTWRACAVNGMPTLQCSELEVPLDYSKPTGDALKLRLVRVPAKSPNAQTKSVIYNPGGPGVSGIESFIENGAGLTLQQTPGEDYHLVTFDPRGTGTSIPFGCPDLARNRDFKDSDSDISNVYDALTIQSDACAGAEYKMQNELIGTAYVARDIKSIANALGEDGLIRYLGYSYGTLLGATTAAMFPRSIDRMVLDGNINPTDYYRGLGAEAVTDVDAAVSRFFELCAAAGPSHCALAVDATTPGSKLQDTFDTFLSGLTYAESYVIRDDFQNALYHPSNFKAFAASLKKYYDDKTSIPKRSLNRRAEDAGDKESQATWGITCGDVVERPRASVENFKSWRSLYKGTSKYAGDVGLLTTLYACSLWKNDAKEKFTGAFANIPTLNPVMFVNSKYDPVTPLVSANHSAAGFQGARVLVSSGMGHCSNAQPSQELESAIKQYFADATFPAESKVYEPDNADVFKSPPPPSKLRKSKRNVDYAGLWKSETTLAKRETGAPVGCVKVQGSASSSVMASASSMASVSSSVVAVSSDVVSASMSMAPISSSAASASPTAVSLSSNLASASSDMASISSSAAAISSDVASASSSMASASPIMASALSSLVSASVSVASASSDVASVSSNMASAASVEVSPSASPVVASASSAMSAPSGSIASASFSMDSASPSMSPSASSIIASASTVDPASVSMDSSPVSPSASSAIALASSVVDSVLPSMASSSGVSSASAIIASAVSSIDSASPSVSPSAGVASGSSRMSSLANIVSFSTVVLPASSSIVSSPLASGTGIVATVSTIISPVSSNSPSSPSGLVVPISTGSSPPESTIVAVPSASPNTSNSAAGQAYGNAGGSSIGSSVRPVMYGEFPGSSSTRSSIPGASTAIRSSSSPSIPTPIYNAYGYPILSPSSKPSSMTTKPASVPYGAVPITKTITETSCETTTVCSGYGCKVSTITKTLTRTTIMTKPTSVSMVVVTVKSAASSAPGQGYNVPQSMPGQGYNTPHSSIKVSSAVNVSSQPSLKPSVPAMSQPGYEGPAKPSNSAPINQPSKPSGAGSISSSASRATPVVGTGVYIKPTGTARNGTMPSGTPTGRYPAQFTGAASTERGALSFVSFVVAFVSMVFVL